MYFLRFCYLSAAFALGSCGHIVWARAKVDTNSSRPIHELNLLSTGIKWARVLCLAVNWISVDPPKILLCKVPINTIFCSQWKPIWSHRKDPSPIYHFCNMMRVRNCINFCPSSNYVATRAQRKWLTFRANFCVDQHFSGAKFCRSPRNANSQPYEAT